MIDLSVLNKYPNVQRYVADYISNEGAGPGGTRLPNLIIWFRLTLEENGVDIPRFFDWDDEFTEEFYSWGSNSRWGNAFRGWLSTEELEYQIDTIVKIAETFGDPDVDEIYPMNNPINNTAPTRFIIKAYNRDFSFYGYVAKHPEEPELPYYSNDVDSAILFENYEDATRHAVRLDGGAEFLHLVIRKG